MAHMRQRNFPATVLNRPLSADFAPRTKEASMLYSMLPSAVQSRLPSLPSLRRSVSMYGLATRRKSADSRPASGARTPEYASAMVLSGAGALSTEEDIAGYLVESLSISSDEDVPQKSTSKGSQPLGMELTESRSGIGWKFANQGEISPQVFEAWLMIIFRIQSPQSGRRRVLYYLPRREIWERELC